MRKNLKVDKYIESVKTVFIHVIKPIPLKTSTENLHRTYYDTFLEFLWWLKILPNFLKGAEVKLLQNYNCYLMTHYWKYLF